MGGGSQRLLRCLAHSSRNHTDTSDGADATLQYYQTRSLLPPAKISPLCKLTNIPPRQKQQYRSPKHRSCSTHHLDANQTQRVLQLGQVLCYAMACILPDLLRCVFHHPLQNNWHCLNLTALSICTHTASLLMATPETNQMAIPKKVANTTASPIQLPRCQQCYSPNLPHVHSITPLPHTHAPAGPHTHHH